MPQKKKKQKEKKPKTKNTHGGARDGAGRKKGSSPLGETTKVMRVPESKALQIREWLLEQATLEKQMEALLPIKKIDQNQNEIYLPANAPLQEIPLYSSKVIAGFPSPADDYIETTLDLNEKLIQDKNATFLLKVQGDSMKDAGIFEGDLLIVDRSITPVDGKIVIASLDGELTVKRLSIKSTGTFLVPENDKYPPIPVREESEITIWGIVTSTIHQF